MNFIYVYTNYRQARRQFEQMIRDCDENKKVYSTDSAYLIVRIGDDSHKFIYTPVKVEVDIMRIQYQTGYVDINPVIEELYFETIRVIKELMSQVKEAHNMEILYELRRDNLTSPVQTKDAYPPCGSDARGKAELGTKITSGDAVLPGGSDVHGD